MNSVDKLFVNYYESAAVILFVIGLVTLLLHNNLIKKIIGMNIMDTAIFLFFVSTGYIRGKAAPIILNDQLSHTAYVNPIPTALILTGIVIAVSVTALSLGLTIKLYQSYGTIELDEIMKKRSG